MTYELTTAFMGLVRQMRKPSNGLLGFFQSRPGNITEASVIEFDVLKQRATVAKAKPRPAEATMNGRDVFATISYTPPVYKEEVPFTIETLKKRQPGFDKYEPQTQTALIMEFAANAVAPLLDKIANAELLQVAKTLHNGTIPFKTDGMADGYVADISFGAPGANFATLTNSTGTLYWSNSSATPLKNLDDFCRLIRTNAGGRTFIRDIIFGYKAFSAMLAIDSVQGQLDSTRINMGGIDAQEADDVTGMAFLGTYLLGGKKVRFWMFDETYIDPSDNSTVKDFLDSKSVYFIGDGDYQLYHGGIDVIKEITEPQLQAFLPATGFIRDIGTSIASSLYVRTRKDEKASAVYLEVTKSPLYVPRTVDTFGRLTVMA